MLKHLQLTPLARVLNARRFWWATPLVAPGLALANPTGGTVTTGGATITAPNASTVQIDQTTASASINWQTFSIANNEYVIFNQPSASAVVLNRVIGNSASEIFGHLTANGRVFLVNPLGVVFAPGSQIDVGALVASTMDISDADFSSGRYVFTSNGSTAGVTNAGRITTSAGGFVVLAGDYVNNTGIVQAQVGQIVLASGSAMTLSIGGNGLINYQVDQAALSDRAGVSNSGQLLADGGRVIMTAKVERSLLATVVNNDGLVQARSIAQGANGEIVLEGEGGNVANSGTLDASGVNGASGGTVRVVSDHATRLAPTSNIDTRGSGPVPLGGFVEVSGSTVAVQGALNIGKGGTFLLDPAQVNIVDGSGVSYGTSANGFIFEQTIESILQSGANVEIVASNKIVVNDLADNVLNGQNSGSGGGLVMGIGTVGGGSCNAYGSCINGTFIRGPGQPGGGTITFLDKKDGIRVDGDLSLIGGSQYGGIDAGPLASANGNILLRGRTVTVTETNAAGSQFSNALAAGGSIAAYAEGGDLTVTGGPIVSHGFTGPASVKLISATGKVTTGAITVGSSSNVNPGQLSIHAYGDVATGALTVQGSGTSSGAIGAGADLVSDNGTVAVTGNVVIHSGFGHAELHINAYGNAGVTGSSINVVGGSDFSYANSKVDVVSNYGGVTLSDLVIGSGREGYGELDVSAHNNIGLGSVSISGSSNAVANVVSQTGSITVGNLVALGNSFSSNGTVLLQAPGGVTLTGTLVKSGDITVNGNVNAAGSVDFEANHSLVINGNLTAGPGSGDTIFLHGFGSSATITTGNLTAGDDITVIAPGNIVLGAVTAGNPLSTLNSYAGIVIDGTGFGTVQTGNLGAGGNVFVTATNALTINGNVTGHHGSSLGPAVHISGGGVSVTGDIVGYGSVQVYTGFVQPGVVGVTVNNVTAYGSAAHPGNIDFDAAGSSFAPENIVVNGAVRAFGANVVEFTADYGNITVHDVAIDGYGNGGTDVHASFTAFGDGVTYGNFIASGLNDTISVSNTNFPSAIVVNADGNISISHLNVTGGGGTHYAGGFGMPDMASATLTAGGNVTLDNADIVGVAHHHIVNGESSSGTLTAANARLLVNAGSSGNITLGSNAGHIRVEGYGNAEVNAFAGGTITTNNLTVIAHAGDLSYNRTSFFANGSQHTGSGSHFGSAEVYLRSGGNIAINGTVTETATGDVLFRAISHNGSVAVNGPMVLTANRGTSRNSFQVDASYAGSPGQFTHHSDSVSTASNGNVELYLAGFNGVNVAGNVTASAKGRLNVRMIGGCSSPGSSAFCGSSAQGPGGVSVTGALNFSNAGGKFHQSSHSYGTNSGVAFDNLDVTDGTGGSVDLLFYGGGNVSLPGFNVNNPGPVNVTAESRAGNVVISGDVTLISAGGKQSFHHANGSGTADSTFDVGEAILDLRAGSGGVTAGNIDVEGFGLAAAHISGVTVDVASVTVRARQGLAHFTNYNNTSSLDRHSPKSGYAYCFGTCSNADLELDASGYGADVGSSTTPGNVLVEGGIVHIGGNMNVHGVFRAHGGYFIGSSSPTPVITADAVSFAVAGTGPFGSYGSIAMPFSTINVGTGQVTLGSDPLQNLVLSIFTPLGAPLSANPNAAFSAPHVELGALNLQGDHVYIRADSLDYFGSVTQAQHDLYVFYDSFTPDADIFIDQSAGIGTGANFGVPGPYPGTTFVIGSTLTFSNVFVGSGGPLTMPNNENFVFLTNGVLTYVNPLSTGGVVVYTQPLIDLAALTYNPQLDQFNPEEDPNKKKDYSSTGGTGDTDGGGAGETHNETSSGLSCH